MILLALNSSRRWMMYTLVAYLVKYTDSSMAESPPPITARGTFLQARHGWVSRLCRLPLYCWSTGAAAHAHLTAPTVCCIARTTKACIGPIARCTDDSRCSSACQQPVQGRVPKHHQLQAMFGVGLAQKP